MNLLLDSHTLLWLMEASPNLSAAAAALITDPMNQLHLSMASVWEISIKMGLRKLSLSVPFATFIRTAINGYCLNIVPISVDDCINYEALPFPDPRHRDPFDRMIITHALVKKLSVVGDDVAFDPYGVTRYW